VNEKITQQTEMVTSILRRIAPDDMQEQMEALVHSSMALAYAEGQLDGIRTVQSMIGMHQAIHNAKATGTV